VQVTCQLNYQVPGKNTWFSKYWYFYQVGRGLMRPILLDSEVQTSKWPWHLRYVDATAIYDYGVSEFGTAG
jgi:hypothetical protein